MTSLTEFLEARIAQDEAAARAAANDAEGVSPGELGPWVVGADTGDHLNPTTVFRPSSWSGHMVHACNTEYAGREALPVARHIARHDPARVLREVTAKRAILEIHNARDSWGHCMGCGVDSEGSLYMEIDDCPILRQLAAVYSDHPDFDPNWSTT